MWGGRLQFTTAMLFAIAMVATFTIGGISGMMHATSPHDLQQTDTYFVVAHFHYVLFGGSIFGIFAGIYYYFPKITGRFLSESLGKLHFWLFFVGMNLTFFPMHYAGLLGMPRRIYTYDAGQGYDTFNHISTIGHGILMLGFLVFVVNYIKSARSGEIAGNNPWDAPSLEWSIPSPPPEYNFAELPTVTSRYPLWDLTHPELTAHVPHSHSGDKHMNVDAAGQRVGAVEGLNPTDRTRNPAESPMHQEVATPRTARELGIPMPQPTIKPLITSLGLVIMISGMLFKHLENQMPFYTVVLGGAAILVGGLYAWLLSPLEDPDALAH